MEEQKFSFKEFFQKAKEYIDNRSQLAQLQITDRLSRLFASLFTDLLRAVFAIFVLFFFSLALGFWLSELLNSNSLGFLATGGIFILLIFLVTWLSKGIEKKITELSISRFLKNRNDDDEEEQDQQSDGA